MSETTVSMESLLDLDLDSFADMPEFVTPPGGTYNGTIKEFLTKDINGKPVLEIKLSNLITVELNDPAATPITDGSDASQAFFLASEYGQGAFKAATANVKEALGVNKLAALIEAVPGMEVTIISKVQKDKKDPTREYFQIVEMFPL